MGSGGSNTVSGSTFGRSERLPTNIGFVIVPQQKAFVVERLGKFHATLSPGFHLLIPFFDRVAYVHSLKEEAITIPNQTAITRDNVVLQASERRARLSFCLMFAAGLRRH